MNNRVIKKTNSIGASSFFSSLEDQRLKLLDLSNRNSLLNYKFPQKGCVKLIDELPNQIFEFLSEKQAFTFIPVPEPSEKELLELGFIIIDPVTHEKISRKEPTAKEWAKILGLDTSFELPEHNPSTRAQSIHQDDKLQTLLYAPSLEAMLRRIRGYAESSIKDSGTNILYLNLGYLEWYESNDSDQGHFSPIFSLPVQLKQNKLDKKLGIYPYEITLKDDSLLTNITLKQRLEDDFDLNLPEIDDLEEPNPEDYFKLIEEKILVHKPKWKISRQATLVRLNFKKQVMYKDLDPNNWPVEKRLENNNILKLFLDKEGEEKNDEGFGDSQDYDMDNIKDIHTKFPIVFDADSSQHNALIEAVNGNNLVIIGPPGTGKSQTIANLIAAELANGKKILFVTEKISALEVVKKRLDITGIGDFCLELHSEKSDKKRILSQLESRLNAKYSYPDEIDSKIQRYENLRIKLRDYAEMIEEPWLETDQSIHNILNKATKLRRKLNIKNPNNLLIENISGGVTTLIKRDELIDQAEVLQNVFQSISKQAKENEISNHYWYGINNPEIKGYETDAIIELLNKWNEKLINLNEYWSKLVSDLEFGEDTNFQINNIQKLSESINILPDTEGLEAFSEIEYLLPNLENFETFITTYERIHQIWDDLSNTFIPDSLNQSEFLSRLAQIIILLEKCKVESKVNVSELATLNSKIEDTYNLANRIEEEFQLIRTKVSNAIKDSIHLTKEGLLNFEILINFLKFLPDELWNQRDDLYENLELDPLILKLSEELTWIKPSHDKLIDLFKLYNVVNHLTELKEAQTSLESGGIFCWFSSEWRKAKNLILSLSEKSKKNLGTLKKHVPELIKYAEGISKINDINKETPILGELYKGAETPIEEIKVLREWYKSIQKEYGTGFGDRVLIGDEIIKIDRSLKKRVVEHYEQNIELYRDDFLQNLTFIIESLPGYESLKNPQKELSGTNSPLLKLNSALTNQINFLSKVLKNPATSFNSLKKCQRLMGVVFSKIENWENSNICKKLVPKVFPVSTKAGQNSTKLFSSARNTYKIFKIVESVPVLINSLNSKPESSRYKILKNCGPVLKKLIEEEAETRQEFIKDGVVVFSEWSKSSQSKIQDLISKNRDAIKNPDWLITWVEYIQLKKKLTKNGFNKILDALEENNIDSNRLKELVELVIYHQLAEEIMSRHEPLKEFKGIEHESILTQFKKCDRELIKLQWEKIAYKASRESPPSGVITGAKSKLTEMGLLENEFAKKRAHIPVRPLLKRAGKSISTLKPCFMMSPMSVAQYLRPDGIEFDLIVMDEASQIRPQDALGSIARAKQLVVVGDPKQLPPTSFFEKLIDEDDENEDAVAIQSSESILDAALPIFSKRNLNWHYRSRHEELIAFSNKHFYNNKLIIFPSPFQGNEKYGIKFNKIKNGRCLAGRNRNEAAAIASAAAEHLMKNRGETLGIVAMGIKQREEIEVCLEQLRKDNPILNNAFQKDSEREEPLFIKNLETVQGDQRDVIMISLTYGPEEGSEKMFQRFPTINTEGGQRRLNVLFTRAKFRMQVFSSMGSADILDRPDAKEGVKALKAFLEYCESGHLHQTEYTDREPDSDFEISVMDELKKYGFKCSPQVGVGGFFLDIAVRDRKKLGRFLMGIECDGATYHSTKSTRDRDRLRQEILENLGWKIYRIWSTDWFKNPGPIVESIVKRLKELETESLNEQLAEKEKTIEKEKLIGLPIESRQPDIIPIPDKKSISKEKPVVVEKDEVKIVAKDQQIIDSELRVELEKLNYIIKNQFPNTESEVRLLRPTMLDQFVNKKPTSRNEFGEMIPLFLRQPVEGKGATGTSQEESRSYLDSVLEIISEFV